MDEAPAALEDPRCLESREMPASFLRFESPREQMAFPYASLIKLELKRDETALELSFVTHQVASLGENWRKSTRR